MGGRIRQQDFDQICRLCLECSSDTNILCSIFIKRAKIDAELDGRTITRFEEGIAEMISSCVGVDVDPSDKLPMNICTECEKQLITLHQFRRKCLASNEYLLEVRLTGEAGQIDAEGDLPSDSLKHPELVLVDSIKEENENDDILTESSCDIPWNDVKVKMEEENEWETDEAPPTKIQKLAKTTNKKCRTTRIPLVTPSTQIVPANTCDNAISCDKSESNEELPKETTKQLYVKKPKMCTVCGMIVKRLRDHMKSHPDALEIRCPHCPSRYLTQKGLLKHIKIQHIEESKPLAKPHTWNRNVAKTQRNFGQSYISSQGIERPEKKMKEPCGNICRVKCTSKITQTQREEIFKHFWSISDLTEKRVFLLRHIERVIPNYRRSSSLRSLNYAFFFEIAGERIHVCKTFFMKTLDISHMFIKTAIRKFDSENGCVEGERRGKCRNVKKQKNV
ncbi:hypothetical protein Bhyg_01918 [Pseudolycoriella hygida]|uniref:ZAD domain-containing protein n=1 Tax=Pseudolycoriella hygida TaxID=35572 RepID=A0A9Q0S825_9DIPT|nr:hypothetical protein Bhyg_01918 [Pseudolycoriella hygida]